MALTPSDFDLSRLPALLARLDDNMPRDTGPYCDVWAAERRESAAAIRTLMRQAEAFAISCAQSSQEEVARTVVKVCEEVASNAVLLPLSDYLEGFWVGPSECAVKGRARGAK